MAIVTVTGGHGTVFSLPFGATANAALGQALANSITTLVNNGTAIPFINDGQTGGTIPTVPAGNIGELVQNTSGLVSLTPAYTAIVVTANAPNATIFGGGAANESVISGQGNLTFFTNGGSGSVAAGGGNNSIWTPNFGSGDWTFTTGDGNDTVNALSGNDSVAPGGGNNSIFLGSGNDTVTSVGNDSISATTGNATISASGQASDFIHGGSGHLIFLNSAATDSTITGGTGSITVFGGPGGGLYQGGLGGDNLIQGGNLATTILGGGNGDTLQAFGSAGTSIAAGIGNETLSGVFSQGSDTLTAGLGNDEMSGGSGADLYQFINGHAGGTDAITNFMAPKGDLADLQGYAPNQVDLALSTATIAGGSTTIMLSDSTRITFQGVTNLTKGDFTTS